MDNSRNVPTPAAPAPLPMAPTATGNGLQRHSRPSNPNRYPDYVRNPVQNVAAAMAPAPAPAPSGPVSNFANSSPFMDPNYDFRNYINKAADSQDLANVYKTGDIRKNPLLTPQQQLQKVMGTEGAATYTQNVLHPS